MDIQVIKKEILSKIIFENLLKNGKVTLEEAELSTKIVDRVVNNIVNEIIENIQTQIPVHQQNQKLQSINESAEVEPVESITSKLNKII